VSLQPFRGLLQQLLSSLPMGVERSVQVTGGKAVTGIRSGGG